MSAAATKFKVDLLTEEEEEEEEKEAESGEVSFGNAPAPASFDARKGVGGGNDGGGAAGLTGEELRERRRRCLEWCLDHGFEYVEADCRDPDTGSVAPSTVEIGQTRLLMALHGSR